MEALSLRCRTDRRKERPLLFGFDPLGNDPDSDIAGKVDDGAGPVRREIGIRVQLDQDRAFLVKLNMTFALLPKAER